MAYTKYSLTPANNNATPPDGAPEGMLPSAVNDTMRDMMAQIRDVGDGIRNGTYTMTAPVITGGSITGVALSGNTFTNPVITGGSINNTPIGASTANTGAFTTLSASGAFSANGGATLGDASGDALTINSSAVSIPNGLTFNSGAVTLSSNPTLSAGTANGVLYLNGSKVATSGTLLTFDGTNLGLGGFADPASGTSVGIYNNTTARLALRNNTTGNTSADGFEIAVTSTNVFISNKENGYTAFENNGSERMRIDSSGRVGINTTTFSTGYLTIDTKAQSGIDIYRSDSTAQYSGIRFRNTTNGSTYGSLGWDSGGLRLDGDAGTMYFSTSGSERMRIDSSGNVGIGTSTLNGAKLFVAQGAAQSPATSGNMTTGMITGSGATGEALNIGTDADGVWYNAAYANNAGVARLHRWLTGGTERMRITSSGNVGIGTSSPGKILSVRGGANVDINYFETGSGQAWSVGPVNIDSGRFNWYNDTAAANRMYLTTGGALYNSTGTYGTISDVSLKENIVDATPKLADVMQIKVRNFNLKADTEKRKVIGVIAQELEQVFPGLIEEVGERVALENGLFEEKTVKAVKYSVLTTILIKAIQEQQAMIEELKQEVAALKAK